MKPARLLLAARRMLAARVLLAALLFLSSCEPAVRTPEAAEPSAIRPAAARVCRIGANGGPPDADAATNNGALLLAERGIGGTGAGGGVLAPSSPQPAKPAGPDRGIGGTGASGGILRTAGVSTTGSTGIVGVITGFGSVCLDGLEVQYDPAQPVDTETGAASTAELRAGELAVVTADGDAPALFADSIAIRHEVIGPVESISVESVTADSISAPDGRVMQVAGQSVLLHGGLTGQAPAPGDWVAVSGLRDARGAIVATRLDRVDPAARQGVVLVHGRLVARDGVLRLGHLLVQPRAGVQVADGEFVAVTGLLDAHDTLDATSFLPDPLQADPATGFSASVSTLYVETYVDAAGLDTYGPAWQDALGSLRDGLGVAQERRVIRFQRQNGRFRAVGLAGAAASGFTSAPVAAAPVSAAPATRAGVKARGFAPAPHQGAGPPGPPSLK